MMYRSVSRKYFAWLYKHVGTFKIERGEDFSFVLLIVSLTTIKGCNIFCAEFKFYLQETQINLMHNELSRKFFKELFDGGVSYDERIHSSDSLSRLTTDVFGVSACLIGTVPELIYALIRLPATCVYLATIDPALTLAVVLIMSVNVIFGRSYAKKLLPISKEVRSLTATFGNSCGNICNITS